MNQLGFLLGIKLLKKFETTKFKQSMWSVIMKVNNKLTTNEELKETSIILNNTTYDW